MDILDPRKYLPGPVRQFDGRSVMATFPDADAAVKAARELRRAGFPETQVDEVSLYPAERGSLREQPWPWTITGEPDRDRRGLIAQDPSVSGSALGGEHLIGGHHYLVTVPLGDDSAPDQVVEIIRRFGGNVDTGGPR